MTHSISRARSLVLVALSLVLVPLATLPATRAAAQAAPPVRPAPPPPPPIRDSAVMLRRPPSSPLPATVAPSGRSAALRATGTAALPATEPVARVSPPVDSFRPAEASRAPVEPLVRTEPPPPPATRAAGVTAGRAALPVSATPPDGATMRCRDGTFLTGVPSRDRCASRGGVATILPERKALPLPPRR